MKPAKPRIEIVEEPTLEPRFKPIGIPEVAAALLMRTRPAPVREKDEQQQRTRIEIETD